MNKLFSMYFWRSAIAGIAVGAVGIGVAELLAGLSRDLTSPIFAVGDRVVDNVPVWLKDLAIEWFGTNDKIALLCGIGSILVIYSALVGVLAFRWKFPVGILGVSLFSIVGSAAALTARSSTQWWVVTPSLAGGLAAVAALWAVYRRTNSLLFSPSALPTKGTENAELTTTHEPDVEAQDIPVNKKGQIQVVDRRKFLYTVAGLTAVSAVAGGAGRWLNARFSAAKSRAEVLLPAPRKPLPATPSEIEVVKETPFFTPNSDFYRIDTALSVPQVPIDTWTLHVHGMVEKEIEITFDDLLNRDLVESDITLTCVSNVVGGELVGTARWLGARLDTLLQEAGVSSEADQIVGRSIDGYTCGFPTEILDGRDALVAVGMNGEPLPLDHGFPARLIVPGLYGYISATKWLTEIELTTFAAFDQYWVPRGYADRAPIKMQSRIDSLQGLQRIAPGNITIGGVAWAQTIGIEAVEVKIDDSDWAETDLAQELNSTTWRQWTFPWKALPGRHTITVRAKDRNGTIQTDERSEPLPNGATGLHKIVVLVDAS